MDSKSNVLDLKTKIFGEIGIPIDHQVLEFGEKRFDDQNALEDLGIGNNSVIKLGMVRPQDSKYIVIKNITGRYIPVEADGDSTVKDIILKLQEANFPLERLNITINKKIPKHTSKISELDFGKEFSYSNLVFRCRGNFE